MLDFLLGDKIVFYIMLLYVVPGILSFICLGIINFIHYVFREDFDSFAHMWPYMVFPVTNIILLLFEIVKLVIMVVCLIIGSFFEIFNELY